MRGEGLWGVVVGCSGKRLPWAGRECARWNSKCKGPEAGVCLIWGK